MALRMDLKGWCLQVQESNLGHWRTGALHHVMATALLSGKGCTLEGGYGRMEQRYSRRLLLS